MKDWFIEIIDAVMVFFIDVFTWLPIKILSLIPVPGWFGSGGFSLPNGVMWFASAFEINTGIAIMTTAFLTRFLIRRIPFIG